MACPTCGSSILFGGIKDGDRRYCSKKCYDADAVSRAADAIPDPVSDEFSSQIHRGNCPKCQGEGPVDVHKSYTIYSALFFTKWATVEHILCTQCARKRQATDLLSSLLLGWWGLPWGVIVTPIIIVADLLALFQNPGAYGPSDALKRHAKLILARRQVG
jgi:hypothetical protein